MVLHRLQGFGEGASLKTTVVLAFTVGLAAGLYLLFRQGFEFLRNFGDIKPQVLAVGFSLFYLSLGAMLLISNAIIAYGAYYHGREASFLLTTPARAEHLFAHQFPEILAYSSWAFLFLAGPLLAAYARTEGLGAHFLLGTGVLIAVFVLIPAGLGMMVAMGAALLAPRRLGSRPLILLGAAAAGVLVVLARTALSWKKAHGQLDATWLFGLLERLAFAKHPLLPSQWLAHGMDSLAAADWGAVLYDLCSLATTAALVFSAGYAMAWALQRRAVNRVLSGAGGGRPMAGRTLERLLEPALAPLFPLAARLLLLKDLKTFFRDPGQWSQALVFFGLLGIYFLNLKELAYPIGVYYWKNLIAFLNLAATCLTLATFTGRFVFPLLSLEGRRFWILGLLPLKRSTLLWGKFWFSFLGTTAVSGALIGVSDLMLEVPRMMGALHAFAVVVVCAGLSGLSVGLGAAFPNLKEVSPAKIVSGFGGTLNLILSLGFMMAVVLLEAIPCHLYYARDALSLPDFRSMIAWCSLFAGLLGLAAVLVPMKMGMAAFRRMDL